MKQKTLLLFQLLLAVFAFYAVLEYSGNLRLLLPLFCLIGMFICGKIEGTITEGARNKQHEDQQRQEEESAAAPFKPLDCLLKSKNVLLLTDAIHHLLQNLDLKVSRSPDHQAVDRLISTPGSEMTLGLKIVGDVAELNENWDKWDELANFDLGKGGKRRLVVIASNALQDGGEGERRFSDFSMDSQNLLCSKHIVGMTTLTLYKICVLCEKKKVDFQLILKIIRNHSGGVFRLEQYARGSGKAA
ncbi:MAG: hypothetical protein ACLFVT_07035 [Syntrophobacteria bacterium]